MAYQALYRKYRPQTFDGVVEQTAIVQTLKNQVIKGNIGHAYLFTGSRGTGKTSIAKIFAKAINCQNNVNGSPCGKCSVCKALSDASNIDIIEIDAASNNRVDEIREIREKVKFLPVSAKYKVYIIDEVHMLTDSAFNALLKTLEEPPPHIVFILATTEVHKLPATILSRCMRFDFSLISTEGLIDYLKWIFKQENLDYEEDAVKAIAVAGEGSVRDALSIADCVIAYAGKNITNESVIKVLGTTDVSQILELAKCVANKDMGKGFEIINDVATFGKNIISFAKNVTNHFRDLLIVKTVQNANKILLLPSDLFGKMQEQANMFTNEKLIECMKLFSEIEAGIKYALSPRTIVEMAFLECVDENVKKN